jgi:Copper transport outer membrane protein, MctB
VFDLRYHVASLAAVFFALVIGILVGVALASHGLGNTERKRLENDLRNAQVQNDALKAKADALDEKGAADGAFVDDTYEVVMENRLKGKEIAVLFVGKIDGSIRSAIRRVIGDAGGGQPVRVWVVKVPVDPAAITKRLASRPPFLAAYAGRSQLVDLGHALGQEFVAGKDTPLWDTLKSLLVEEQIGSSERPADGVVLVRTADPQTGATALFLQGLYSGLRDVGAPAVGVERSTDDGSAIKTFQELHLSTVNNVDEPIGKLALAILLGNPQFSGDYGAPPASQWLPNVPPVTTTTGG